MSTEAEAFIRVFYLKSKEASGTWPFLQGLRNVTLERCKNFQGRDRGLAAIPGAFELQWGQSEVLTHAWFQVRVKGKLSKKEGAQRL